MADKLTAAQVLEAVQLDPRNPMDRGALMHLERRAQEQGSGMTGLKLRELAQAKLDSVTPVTSTHTLPWAGAKAADSGYGIGAGEAMYGAARAEGDGRKAKELGAADIMWLGRLPADPAQVSAADAKRLAELSLAVVPGSSDQVLLDSVFKPVRAHHERKAAAIEVENARRRLNPVEATPGRQSGIAALAEQALAVAIRDQEPALHDDEARSRARREVGVVVDRMKEARLTDLTYAESRLADVRSGVLTPLVDTLRPGAGMDED